MPILAIGLFLDCIFFLYVSPETANITKFISKSSSPSYAVEGKKLLLSGTIFLMVQLPRHSMSLLRVMEVTHLLGRGLGLAT